MPIPKAIIFILTILTLNGCSAPPIKPVDATLNDTNSSILNFQRNSQFVNGGVTYRIFVNNEYIGPLSNGGYFSRRVSKGKKLIEFKPYEFGGIPSVGRNKTNISVEPKYEYFIKIGNNLEGITPIGNSFVVETSNDVTVTRKSLE